MPQSKPLLWFMFLMIINSIYFNMMIKMKFFPTYTPQLKMEKIMLPHFLMKW